MFSTAMVIASAPISFFRPSGEPSATILPASTMHRRWHSRSASSRYCVVRKMVMPSFLFSSSR